MIAAEAKEMNPGGETVITRLADILVVHAIRFWITNFTATQTGWLGALHDRQIAPVIAKIHRRPAGRWTLAMHYVTRWQMNAARSQLAQSDQTVAEVAHLFGYESEAAFNSAFKRHMGISPGAAKRMR